LHYFPSFRRVGSLFRGPFASCWANDARELIPNASAKIDHFVEAFDEVNLLLS
jgi:hypothetical protein